MTFEMKFEYKDRLETEAIDLATAMDNPASVMIRKLLDRIADLKTANNLWSDKNWAMMEKIDALKKRIEELENK